MEQLPYIQSAMLPSPSTGCCPRRGRHGEAARRRASGGCRSTTRSGPRTGRRSAPRARRWRGSSSPPARAKVRSLHSEPVVHPDVGGHRRKLDAAPWEQAAGAGGHRAPDGRLRDGEGPADARWSTRTLRYHGLDNLFVVDGSVFPTSLGVNPQETHLRDRALGEPVRGRGDGLSRARERPVRGFDPIRSGMPRPSPAPLRPRHCLLPARLLRSGHPGAFDATRTAGHSGAHGGVRRRARRGTRGGDQLRALPARRRARSERLATGHRRRQDNVVVPASVSGTG